MHTKSFFILLMIFLIACLRNTTAGSIDDAFFESTGRNTHSFFSRVNPEGIVSTENEVIIEELLMERIMLDNEILKSKSNQLGLHFQEEDTNNFNLSSIHKITTNLMSSFMNALSEYLIDWTKLIASASGKGSTKKGSRKTADGAGGGGSDGGSASGGAAGGSGGSGGGGSGKKKGNSGSGSGGAGGGSGGGGGGGAHGTATAEGERLPSTRYDVELNIGVNIVTPTITQHLRFGQTVAEIRGVLGEPRLHTPPRIEHETLLAPARDHYGFFTIDYDRATGNNVEGIAIFPVKPIYFNGRDLFSMRFVELIGFLRSLDSELLLEGGRIISKKLGIEALAEDEREDVRKTQLIVLFPFSYWG
ncbi:MAG: hypothetical protein BGO28_05510 [Alphaproteobacteria bacterium 43-37]|nr:MAG: hypothetical protein BGO28_05510 [Alphaproteobacteria bacterium 43-37]